jgi:hypothetical protein
MRRTRIPRRTGERVLKPIDRRIARVKGKAVRVRRPARRLS